MTLKQGIFADLLVQARFLRTFVNEALMLIDELPRDEDAFVAMAPSGRVATTALPKSFEQLGDTLNGLFRAILRILGIRLKGLFPLDIAHRMEKLNVIDDPDQFVAIVKLRNELVHEHPSEAALRFDRMRNAHRAFPYLFDAAARADQMVRDQRLLESR